MVKEVNQYVLALDVSGVRKNSIGLLVSEEEDQSLVQFIHLDEPITCKSKSIKKFNIKKTGKKNWKNLDNGYCEECEGDCNCYELKICDRCHILKRRSIDFEYNQNDKWGRPTYRPSCKECREIIDGVPMNASEKRRASSSKPSGIWQCPICKKKQIVEMMASPPRKDHNHLNGKFREYICDSCNTGLGRFKDSIEVLKRAIDYLEKHDL